jgi:hypothetical protein
MRRQARGCSYCILSDLFAKNSVRGTQTPGYAHSATMRVKDFLCCGLRQGPRSVSFVFFLVYIPLWGERTINERETNKQNYLTYVQATISNKYTVIPSIDSQRSLNHRNHSDLNLQFTVFCGKENPTGTSQQGLYQKQQPAPARAPLLALVYYHFDFKISKILVLGDM